MPEPPDLKLMVDNALNAARTLPAAAGAGVRNVGLPGELAQGVENLLNLVVPQSGTEAALAMVPLGKPAGKAGAAFSEMMQQYRRVKEQTGSKSAQAMSELVGLDDIVQKSFLPNAATKAERTLTPGTAGQMFTASVKQLEELQAEVARGTQADPEKVANLLLAIDRRIRKHLTSELPEEVFEATGSFAKTRVKVPVSLPRGVAKQAQEVFDRKWTDAVSIENYRRRQKRAAQKAAAAGGNLLDE